MQSFKDLYHTITPDFVRIQIWNASRRKEKRPYVQKVLKDDNKYANEIYSMLWDRGFQFSPHRAKTIYDPHSKKSRDLLIPEYYPDHIVCWVYVQMMKPLFLRGLYPFTYSSLPKRGLDSALKQVQYWIDTDPTNTQFVGEADIHRCYQSVWQDKLLSQIDRRCRDKNALWLSEQVVRSVPKGLPIGDYPSPWLTNYHLQDIDHMIKEVFHIPHYERYLDNLLLFSSDKNQLHECLNGIEEVLRQEHHMTLNSDKQVYPLRCGLDWLGLVFYPYHTKLRARNFLAFTRQARDLCWRIDNGEEISLHEALSVECRAAMVRRCDSYNIFQKYFAPEYEREIKHITRKMMRTQHLVKSLKDYPTKKEESDYGLYLHQLANGWQRSCSGELPGLPWDSRN